MGISCSARHAVHRASIVPQFPFKSRVAPSIKNVARTLIIPMTLTAIAPAARHFCGIRSHITAATSAAALHIVIE
jgi:hypothetical protein